MENEKITISTGNEICSGVVQIADDVVASIAALAACEVKGVNSMAGVISGELVSKVISRIPDKGVKVQIAGRHVAVELHVVMEYGYSIPATCNEVQTKVKAAIENMTGLECNTVNIRIAGVRV